SDSSTVPAHAPKAWRSPATALRPVLTPATASSTSPHTRRHAESDSELLIPRRAPHDHRRPHTKPAPRNQYAISGAAKVTSLIPARTTSFRAEITNLVGTCLRASMITGRPFSPLPL